MLDQCFYENHKLLALITIVDPLWSVSLNPSKDNKEKQMCKDNK